MGNVCCFVVGPDEALLISGGIMGESKTRQILGGFGCACPFWAEAIVLPLNIITLLPSVVDCETKQGK